MTDLVPAGRRTGFLKVKKYENKSPGMNDGALIRKEKKKCRKQSKNIFLSLYSLQ